jgi:tetratricopeptide (TPR) repeat protein
MGSIYDKKLIKNMKPYKFNIIFLPVLLTILFSGFMNVTAQSGQSELQNLTNSANNYRNSIAKQQEEFMYEPYIPTHLDPAMTDAEYVKSRMQKVIKGWVIPRGEGNPSYKNVETSFSLEKIYNEEVTDDYIRFTSGNNNDYKDTVTIYFKDVLNSRIEYFTPFRNGETCYTKIGSHKFCCCWRELPDLLYYMQYYYGKTYSIKELERFQQISDNYQTLNEKPNLSEEQRKYIIQANALNDIRDYTGAIQYYDKAIALNPVSYPAGYYNLAIIAGLAGNYNYAILNMKKYLLLLPNAADAREAQDKIYGWEALTTNN